MHSHTEADLGFLQHHDGALPAVKRSILDVTAVLNPLLQIYHGLGVDVRITKSRSSHQSCLRPATLLRKETLVQVFSCKFCEISKKTFLIEHLWAKD